MKRFGIGGLLAAAFALTLPGSASAFCGFYVSSGPAPLFNRASNVVLMRDGTRTVLSMQNAYQGPPESFAMVVPVPVVLQESDVRTLPRDVFARVDAADAPKLVEYWEQNPCPPPIRRERLMRSGARPPSRPMMAGAGRSELSRDLGVRVEAQFEVGEYQIVILSAQEASGLETWLHREHYQIPEGASAALAPYVQAGMKFFVARVNVELVHFENGQAMLSPLRFHYDSEQFSLPVRLGLLNSSGTQDLIVHILARGTRYDVANYENVFAPTNVDVSNRVRGDFAGFYAALFDKTLERHPGAVVTEYAWEGAIPEYLNTRSSCDPASPIPPRPAVDLTTLGLDVLPPSSRQPFVLTRLHLRYSPSGLRDDLVFRQAPPVVGGREEYRGRSSNLGQQSRGERGARISAEPSSHFQARYAIRHYWRGAVTCESPVRGVWGGPPDGRAPTPAAPATNVAFARRGARLESLIRHPIPELGLRPAGARRGGSRKLARPKGWVLPVVVGAAPLLGVLGLRIRKRRRG